MTNPNRHVARPAVMKCLLLIFLGTAGVVLAGCESSERDENDGQLFNTIILPTDVVLNLACDDMGVHPETCVLEDPENPFALVPISEFDVNNPEDEFNKFELANSIPFGPNGAKARFYLWATALARFPSGENQYYTALALHELFDANSNDFSEDELIQEQAKKAYRSVLDNFFGSVTVFTCFACIPESNFPVPLNERVADHLYRTESTNFRAPDGLRRLVPGDPTQVLELMLDWGYAYQPCTDLPNCTNGVVSVIEGP
jgi:hypothetical protein